MNNNFIDELKSNINDKYEVNIICEKFSLKAFSLIISEINKCEKINILFNIKNYFNSVDEINIFNLIIDSKNSCWHDIEIEKYFYFNEWKKIIEQEKVKIKIIQSDELENTSFLIIKNKNNGELISYSNFGNITYKNLLKKSKFVLKNNSDEYSVLLLNEFKRFWHSNESYDFSLNFNKNLNLMSSPISCSDMYYESIFCIFRNEIQNMNNIENNVDLNNSYKKSEIYQSLFDFQKNAVYGIIDKLEKINGCILADSVGLGKTYEALGVIKYYEIKRQKVLVLVPKKLRENWTIFTQNSRLNPFINDRFFYDIKNHTDLNRKIGFSGDDDLKNYNWSDYDLLVIDESHNFKNYKWTNDENKSRYQLIMEKIIKSGRKTKVLLLSATPVNNRMQDLSNQIKFITNDDDSAFSKFGIDSINSVCKNAEIQSNKWSNLPIKERNSKKFSEMIGVKFKNLLNLVSIARSRKQILSGYSETKLSFPKRNPPINLTWKIDESSNLSINEINASLNDLTLALYKPLNYVYDEFINLYFDENLNKSDKKTFYLTRENGLVSLMKINLLKRMESSIHSFNITLKKIIENSRKIVSKIEKNENSYITNIIDDNDFDEEDVLFQNNLKINLNHLDKIKFLSDIKYDIENLTMIFNKTMEKISNNDSKLNLLIKTINDVRTNKININNKKILIFTSFQDTAIYLYNELSKKFILGMISGNVNKSNHVSLKNIKIDTNDLLTYFSPISKKIENSGLDKKIEIDILIATDCISEGQNLQDCATLINYDIHWNPVRIIQRFGRIDRLNSKNEYIQLINMWPDIELDDYIKLESKIQTKMEKVVHSSTGDDHLLKSENELTNEENFRLDQLQKLKENIDLYEENKNEVSFSSLILNEYIIHASRYSSEKKYNSINGNWGFYSIVNFRENIGNKGIIFLFKKNIKNNPNNPIDPYIFVYLNMDGELEYPIGNINSVLEILKNYALSKNNDFSFDINFLNKDLENDYYKKIKKMYLLALLNLNSNSDEVLFERIFDENANISSEKIDYSLISFLLIK